MSGTDNNHQRRHSPPPSERHSNNRRFFATAALVGAAIPLGGALFAAMMYRVASPHEYLVRTGLFINGSMGMQVSRKGFLLPGQKLQRVGMNPRNLHFTLKCLSQQYLPFKMPVTYTFTPFDPTGPPVKEKQGDAVVDVLSVDLFKRYVQKMDGLTTEAFETTILGVIHGETRVLTAQMSIDAINDDRDSFKKNVIERVQTTLLPYGVRVDNANIAELIEDVREGQMGYLQARERKKLSSAVQESEVDVAEAEKMGDIGKKIREAETRQAKAKLEAETKQLEFDQQQKVAIAYANLCEVKAESKRREEVSMIEATAAAHQKKEELQNRIEEARAINTVASKRADQLTQQKVESECLLVKSEAVRDAAIVEANGRAAAIELVAKANRFEGEARAAVTLAELMAKANGERALLDAQAEGTRALVSACGGNPQILEPILMIYNRIPQKVAEEGAKAVQGLNPQIWSMGGDDAGTTVAKMVGGMAPVVEMFKRQLAKGKGETD